MKSIIIILSILLVSLKSISQNKPTRQSFQDSIYNSSNTLSKDFIKIKYVGLQNHPLPPIYIEKEGECNTSTEQCSCVATRSFYGGYFTYAFLVSVYSYDSCKKWVLENMQNVHYDSSSLGFGSFEICIKSETHIDTMYAYSFRFLEDLKKKIIVSNHACYLWIIPAINELEESSRYYIKPDEYNKRPPLCDSCR